MPFLFLENGSQSLPWVAVLFSAETLRLRNILSPPGNIIMYIVFRFEMPYSPLFTVCFHAYYVYYQQQPAVLCKQNIFFNYTTVSSLSRVLCNIVFNWHMLNFIQKPFPLFSAWELKYTRVQ